jgi:hypothetical protein
LYRTSPTPETAHTGKNQTEDPVLRQRKALFSSLLEQDHLHETTFRHCERSEAIQRQTPEFAAGLLRPPASQ